jgi:hypothetical protein
MTALADLKIYTGKIEGRYVVATGRSPYFYFEADTEEGARDLARRALAFYRRALDKHDGHIPSPTFTDSIKAKELVA